MNQYQNENDLRKGRLRLHSHVAGFRLAMKKLPQEEYLD